MAYMDWADQTTLEEMQAAYRLSVEAQMDGYRSVLGYMNNIGERNAGFARSMFDVTLSQMERYYEGNRAFAGALKEQSSRQREALRELTDESMDVWSRVLDTSVEDHRHGLELAEQTVEETMEVVEKTAENVREVQEASVETAARATADTVETVKAEAEKAEAEFPIKGYDDLNVEQVKKHLDGLNSVQIRTVRDHEKRNKNRDTLVEQFDRKLKAQFA